MWFSGCLGCALTNEDFILYLNHLNYFFLDLMSWDLKKKISLGVECLLPEHKDAIRKPLSVAYRAHIHQAVATLSPKSLKAGAI